MNPYLEVLTAGVIWGSAGVFIKLLSLPPTTITFLRLSIAAIVLFPYLKIKRVKIINKNNYLMFFISFLNGIRSVLYFVAFSLTSIGNAVIILYTWPIFSSLFSLFYLKEKLTLKKILLFSLAFIGIVIMFSNKTFIFNNIGLVGMIAMLLSALIYGLMVPIQKKALKQYSRSETIFYQNIIGGILFVPFLFINKPFPTLQQFAIATVYAVLIGVIASLIFFSALKKIPASTASLLSYLEVVSAIIFGVIIFHEQITVNMIIGGCFIIISSIFITKLERQEVTIFE